MSLRIAFVAAAMMVFSAIAPAYARTLAFSFVGDRDVSWMQSSRPTPDIVITNGYAYIPVSGGVSNGANFSHVYMYNDSAGPGGFAISENGLLIQENGPAQFYTGSESHPVFSAGKFELPNGTMTVTALPEPSTWALSIIGFGGIGLALRFGRASRSQPV